MQLSAISLALTRIYGGGVAPFTPASLFANSEVGAWYDPSDLTTMFQDSTGTTPVTADGQPVGLILDKSGNDNSASQSTAAYRPLRTTAGTANWINYDSVDDVTNTTFASSLGTDCTVARSVVGGNPIILTGQTIGTSYSASTDHAGLIIIDRALTTQETIDVTAWLLAKGDTTGITGPEILVPANQTIFTVSVPNTITASRDAEIYADGVGIGEARPGLSWTPAGIDRDVTLEAVYLGSSGPTIVAVCEANALTTALTGWTQTNVATVGGQTDYSGGTSAYKVTAAAGTAQHHISKSPSPAMTNAKTGFEITVKAGTNSKIMIYLTTSTLTRRATYDINTKQGFCDALYVQEVEDMGNGFKRLWCAIADSLVGLVMRIYHTNTFDILSAASVAMVGTETFFALNPRMTDGPLPLTNFQKCGFWESGTTAFGAKRWTLSTEFNTSVAQMGQVMYLDVLLPDSYTTATQYRVVYLMPVEAGNGTVLNNELEEVYNLGLHNSMNCIFVRPYFIVGTGNRTWGGIKNDGTINHDAYISDMLPGFMARFYSVDDTREGRSILGYSAGAFAALTQAQRRPDVWGYCCAWDAPWTAAYTAFDQAAHFGTEAQYNLFHPYQNFASLKSAFTDKARLIVGGSYSFASDTSSMYSRLVTELGNPLNNGGGDYATTITDASGKWWKLNKTESAHDFIPGWVTPAMAALQVLWGL